MALTLKEIQAKLMQEQANKDRVKGGTFSGDSAIYPFWTNPDGSTATMRFLPDGDPSNDYFWVERLMVRLPFRGIKGQNDSKACEVQVPSMDMWKAGSCPINAEIRPWWKDESLVDLARKYYRKKSFLFQSFVGQNPNKEDNAPENPIRRQVINPGIFDIVKGILLRPDLEFSPTDYENGRDFYLTKTTKGQYANYATSSWSMKERALNEAERAAIEKFGLFNLSSFLPKKPDEDGVQAIAEMFQASVEDQPYDMDRWGKFFKPNGMRVTDNGEAVSAAAVPVARPVQVTVAKPVQETVAADTPPWEDAAAATEVKASKPSSPDEILAAIRARQKK
ncbi:hypothetical protein UFOVP29_246 [uncultured Caudovirales phage]|uniref:Single-stranded DNA-binding protein n=1 Tax=uncultured Caudovirales phage TaxID=2100421 RepID=A0A6J5KQJ2_9CAUD|nr:hypothetical protein UFOVP29_246 [uncultured Caudovirales phage]